MDEIEERLDALEDLFVRFVNEARRRAEEGQLPVLWR